MTGTRLDAGVETLCTWMNYTIKGLMKRDFNTVTHPELPQITARDIHLSDSL